MLKKIRGFKKKRKNFIKSYTKNRKRIILEIYWEKKFTQFLKTKILFQA